MMVIQQWEKLLPYAQQLGIKYEIRVCSHLLSCYLLLTTVDNPLSISQWDRCYSILQEMVGCLMKDIIYRYKALRNNLN